MIIINCPMHSLFTQKRKVFPSWKVSHSAKEKKNYDQIKTHSAGKKVYYRCCHG